MEETGEASSSTCESTNTDSSSVAVLLIAELQTYFPNVLLEPTLRDTTSVARVLLFCSIYLPFVDEPLVPAYCTFIGMCSKSFCV